MITADEDELDGRVDKAVVATLADEAGSDAACEDGMSGHSGLGAFMCDSV